MVNTIVICNDAIVSGGGDGLIKVWCLSTLSCTATFQGHTGSIQVLCSSPKRSIVFSGSRFVEILSLSFTKVSFQYFAGIFENRTKIMHDFTELHSVILNLLRDL